jgi:hypothetical protein
MLAMQMVMQAIAMLRSLALPVMLPTQLPAVAMQLLLLAMPMVKQAPL